MDGFGPGFPGAPGFGGLGRRANEARLQLSVLAYNLGNLWRRLLLPPKGRFVRERSPRGEVSGQWPGNKDLRPVPRRRGLS